jgi:hypothetical protein
MFLPEATEMRQLPKSHACAIAIRVTAKQIEIAERYGVDPATLFPEPEPLPPPELFPKRSGARAVTK